MPYSNRVQQNVQTGTKTEIAPTMSGQTQCTLYSTAHPMMNNPAGTTTLEGKKATLV